MNIASQIVMKPISEIKPYIRNPRKNDKTVKLLVDIIPKVGFNVPLVVDSKGIIVKGHARFAAAIKLGMSEVPCVVTDADEEAIKLDRIADNKISEFSQWITDELMHEVDALNIDFDLGSLGFELPDFASELADFGSPAVVPDGKADSSDEQERREKFEQMLAERAAAKEAGEVAKQIERAEQKQAEIGARKDKYFKVTCPDCGKVMYVKEGDAVWEKEE